ncbi:MAG: fumarylacetoacetate hydrolase family protein [Bacteroidota bacterium]|nr:fumarylacetoacetate hydrolase family protein [Bacteroidota bacterium]MDE2835389.1 fumarylacetoacetate hydrolase family protein [Bacteroidota bacterium]MDE2957835.1 fumarylacetoacetate hydrolase family protein [Bacteroidota bacterium]
MRLIRFGPPGAEKPGLLLPDGWRVDASGLGMDYGEEFFGGDGLQVLTDWLSAHQQKLTTVDPDARLGPPVCRPSKLICIGLNYADHARESGMAPPREPVLFFKATSAICGPYDDVLLPGRKTDWEVELAVIIGPQAHRVTEEEAMSHVAGYVLHNDYSERNWQLERGGQWVKGKSYDTFAPLGPFWVTPDEIPDPNNLALWLTVNGKRVQDGSTSNFVFNVAQLVSYVSRFMTLLPGDIISTGTPAGVGLGMNPPRYLQPGDVVELGIEGLGWQRQVARRAYAEREK